MKIGFQGKHRKEIKSNKGIFIILLGVICIICVCMFIYNKFVAEQNKSFYEDIKVDETIIEQSKDKDVTENMAKVISLQKENSDVIGWIQIDNTIIDYPLLQTTDNEYYLKHNYKKEVSKYGSIYLKSECNLDDKNSNVIIYGHNMNDDQMFNSLLKYQEKEYYNNHKTIKIATEKEEAEYKIVSVFKSRIFYQDEEDVFRYYNYIKFSNAEEYNKFIDECKKFELYNTGVSAELGEQLITLITCEYSQQNGRMVVVGKRIG